METKAEKEKKVTGKTKKKAPARQDKKETLERNINAAIDAVAKYSTKTEQ